MREEFNIILETVHSPKHTPLLDAYTGVTEAGKREAKTAFMLDRYPDGVGNAICSEQSAPERSRQYPGNHNRCRAGQLG